MKQFFKPVNKKSRKAMIEFLTGHFRYNTMNSWNQSTSYAHNIKIHNLDLTAKQRERAYEMLDVEDAFDEMNMLIRLWEEQYKSQWQVGSNGRSGGYLVLYQGGLKESDYKSFCQHCGQGNCTRVEENDGKCGVCGKKRTNYSKPKMEKFSWPGKSTDQDEDFSEWEIYDIRARVELVQSFDKLVDQIVKSFVAQCDNYKVVERTIRVPKKIHVMVEN